MRISDWSSDVCSSDLAAIKADPGNSRARYYTGLAMAQDGRLEDAIDVWQSLAADSPAGSPRLGLLRLQIGRAAQELGIEPPPIARPQEPGPEAPAEVPRGDRKSTRLNSSH